ncbi:MAG: TetR family transcriptional regulator [Clostridia bacterium]|nr:TetR family transcriptional regulator [Clostridia bacterium]
MVKKTAEQVASRREEIVNSCEKLYQTMSFKEITLKEIGEEVPFSRPTIYNYFQTKEEIFLALFEREYDRWNGALTSILDGNDSLGKEELAEKIARSLSERVQLLKLLSMNNYDMEANSRTGLLTDFKKAYGRSMELFCMILTKFFPGKSDEEIRNIIYIFFPFMFGIYPYAEVTEKQREAMREAGVGFVYRSVYEITFNCLIKLL